MAGNTRQRKQIDVNRADREQLMEIEGIDSERAEQILQYRQAHGRFESWQELSQVPGIGEVMLQKVQASAELRTSGELEQEEEEPSIEGRQEVMLRALSALAELDAAAVEVYRIGLERIELPQAKEQLAAYRADHRRHVRDLNRIISRMGGEAIDEASAKPDGALLTGLAAAVSAFGPSATLNAMIANEQLTNATYASALELGLPDEIEAIVERNREDEARHLDGLMALLPRMQQEMAEPPQPM